MKEDDIEEEDDLEEKDITNVSDEELEEDEPNLLGDNVVLDDDVNEDMLKMILMTMLISSIIWTPFLN